MLTSRLRAAATLAVALPFTVPVAGCVDAPPTLPEAASVAIATAPLTSGGEGVLVSEGFASVEFRPARDSVGTLIPNRWTDLRVLVDGTEVDSWRIDDTSVGIGWTADFE